MSLHCVAIVLAAVCISCHMQSVQSQPPSFRSSKWGFGACPKVPAMEEFDITKIYGEQWYLIAHYSEVPLLDRHCSTLRFSDSNPGSDVCRVSVEELSIKYEDEEILIDQFYLLLPNETNPSTWIDTLKTAPTKTYVLASDYDTYLQLHECNQFPRDNPFLYEQHNYILSRQAVWKGGFEDFQEGLDLVESFGIDTGPFMLHDQEDCKQLTPGQPGISVPLNLLKRLLG